MPEWDKCVHHAFHKHPHGVGPKSTGKSHGLQEMAQVWSEQGHVVIDINLKDLALTSELCICHMCSSHLHNKTTAAAPPSFFSCWLSNYGLEGTASFTNNLLSFLMRGQK